MINKILNQSSWYCCAGTFSLGATLLLVGSLMITHAEMSSGVRIAGALTCFGGALTTAGAFVFTAMKIDAHYKNNRAEPQALYIPPEGMDWDTVRNANSIVRVAPSNVQNYDAAVIRNANWGDNRNRWNNEESSLYNNL